MDHSAAVDEAGSEPLKLREIYRKSWIDRLSSWVDRLPGSGWAYYLGFWLVLVLAQAIVMWIEGASSVRSFHPAQAFLAGAVAFMLASFRSFDRRAAAALSGMRALLEVDEAEYRALNYRLTALPMLPTLFASLVALGVLFLSEAIVGPYWLELRSDLPISALFLRIIYLLSWAVFGAFLYQSVHRLGWINRIYTRHTRINLFRMKPVHGFSMLTALTAASLTVLPIGFLISNSIRSLEPASLAVVLGVEAVAILTFIWPQMGIHRLQVAEKDRLMEEANQRFEATILELHRRVDLGELDKIDELNMTLSTLELELKALKRIRTWPWEPETLNWLVTGLVLPLGLLSLQYVLQRLLGP